MRSRRKIIDATTALIESGGFGAVSIAAVAQAADVSRQTIYSIFGSREQLVSESVADLLYSVVSEIQQHLDATETPFEYLVELLVAGRSAVRSHPVLMALGGSADNNPVFDADMMARAAPVARTLLQPLVDREPDLPDLDEIATVLIRMALSVILFDDPYVHSDDDLRRYLRRWLLPAMPFDS